MANYDIYVLGESDITISGGGQLDGVTQGDGSHLSGRTITLNSNGWVPIAISDNDDDFDDNDGNQVLDGTQQIDGVSYASGTRVEAEYGVVVTDGTGSWTLVGLTSTTPTRPLPPSKGWLSSAAVAGFLPSGCR